MCGHSEIRVGLHLRHELIEVLEFRLRFVAKDFDVAQSKCWPFGRLGVVFECDGICVNDDLTRLIDDENVRTLLIRFANSGNRSIRKKAIIFQLT